MKVTVMKKNLMSVNSKGMENTNGEGVDIIRLTNLLCVPPRGTLYFILWKNTARYITLCYFCTFLQHLRASNAAVGTTLGSITIISQGYCTKNITTISFIPHISLFEEFASS